MPRPQSAAEQRYSPLYFLGSLGTGGLTVTFFMYLMFWVPHPDRPVPVFEDLTAAFATGSPLFQATIALAWAGIAVFALLNIKSLVWNLKALRRFRHTDAFRALRQSNGETTLLAAPLAMAMTVNALFIVGLVFVPGLWGIVEYLFPAALMAFLLIGFWALSLIGGFLGRVLSTGGAFDMTAHNSFAQLLPAFALSMVGVGLSAPAAMSSQTVIVATSLVLSTIFGVAALVYAVVAAITGLAAMLQHGTARESAPTLMIIIPLATVLGILFLRQDHGLHTAFATHGSAGETLTFLARLLTVQLLFLLLGAVVLRRQDYFGSYVLGRELSPGSYALVCPGVALSVMLHFFINKGLVAAGVIEKFGPAFWSLTGLALLAQALMIALILRLNWQHFRRPGLVTGALPVT